MVRHFIHYHKHKDAMKRLKEASEIPIAEYSDGKLMKYPISFFDKVGRNRAFPEDLIDCVVWGVSKNKGKWYISTPLRVKWTGPREDIPDYVTTSTLFEEMSHYATCPTEDSWYYVLAECAAVGDLHLPRFGKRLKQLSSIQFSGLFTEIDSSSFIHYTVAGDDSYKLPLEELSICIHCNSITCIDSDYCELEEGGCGNDFPFDPRPSYHDGIRTDWKAIGPQW